MSINIFRLCVILGVVFFMPGCEPNPSLNTPAKISDNTHNGNQYFLKQIITNEAPPEQKQTPEQTVLNEIQWKLSNDKIVSASKESLIWNIIFGKNSLVVMKSPEITPVWYNSMLLTHSEQTWSISSVVDMPIVGELHSEKHGLALPMDSFAAAKLAGLGSAENNIWTFANESKYVAIGKYPRESLTPPPGFQEISLNGHEGWVKIENENSFLFYFDKEYLVWVSGNMTKEEIQKLATSLPNVESSTFPNPL